MISLSSSSCVEPLIPSHWLAASVADNRERPSEMVCPTNSRGQKCICTPVSPPPYRRLLSITQARLQAKPLTSYYETQRRRQVEYQRIPYFPVIMHFHLKTRRNSSDSNLSTSSSTSTLDDTLRTMTLPMAPREDDYNMSEKQRQARILAKCKRAEKAPWRDARPLPAFD
jgi:hypothetical protein